MGFWLGTFIFFLIQAAVTLAINYYGKPGNKGCVASSCRNFGHRRLLARVRAGALPPAHGVGEVHALACLGAAGGRSRAPTGAGG
jgi:hypothetical protein